APPGPITVECAGAIPTPAILTANDNCDGTLTATASDGPPVGSVPFDYTITRTWTVSDTHGNAAVPVTQLITVRATTVTVSSQTVCTKQLPVSMTATPNNGTGPYHYAWTVPSGASDPGDVASFSATVSGVYSVIMTDNTGCQSQPGSG